MIGDFETILALVGTLDDSPGDRTARDRFRTYLATGLNELGSVRDAVQTCTTHSGPQYARALQDLVNFLGSLIGFEVEFGRYAGVQGQVGHDGMWRSGERVVVVEVKTTDAYTINTATLPNYINSLRTEGRISPDDKVIGLYVYARVDPSVKQLEHAIVAEKRTQELRVGSVDAILSLAELIRSDVIGHDEALAILWPADVWIDDTVNLLQRISAIAGPTDSASPASGESGTSSTAVEGEPHRALVPADPGHEAALQTGSGPQFFLIPAADIPDETARETIAKLVGKEKVWAFRRTTPNRQRIKVGDRVAFYQASFGVVATAEVASVPEDKPMPGVVKDPDKYRWTFRLADTHLFLDDPVVIDAELRSRLDEFANRDPNKVWSWFVFGARQLTAHDFALLSGTSRSGALG